MILASDSLKQEGILVQCGIHVTEENLKGIALALPEFEKFGFTRLPVHVEESGLALAASNKVTYLI